MAGDWRSTWGCGRGLALNLGGVAGGWALSLEAGRSSGYSKQIKTNQNITREFQKWRDLKIKWRTRESTGKKSTK